MKRTHMCGLVDASLAGETVTLQGWVQRTRDRGSILFVLLRDREGIMQITFDQEKCAPEVFEAGKACRGEYVLEVTGLVALRDEAAINDKMKTGYVEVFAQSATILNKAQTPPIYIDDDHPDESESVRLKYRYLDLRRASLQETLRLRHRVQSAIRAQLDEGGFTEIETPILTKSTPEGARDFLVPSRVQQGSFYALPQSPQIYKQLTMLAGMDRYYQIARCFRDEDNRADRQPEFTQLDLEMSFVEESDVQEQIEGVWKRVLHDVFSIDHPFPLPRVTWTDAMNLYGSDKPDRRFGLELVDITALKEGCGFSVFEGAREVRGINAKGCAAKLSRKEIDALGEYVKTYRAKGLAWIVVEESGVRSPIAKFIPEEKMNAIVAAMGGEAGDVLFFVADRRAVVLQALGNLRCEIARRLDMIDHDKLDLFWVTEFPMFEWNEETEQFDAMHHPFTASMPEDEEKVERSELGEVRARAYDLVLNGIEMGSGSIRIHDGTIQARTFDLLGLSKEEVEHRFGFLLEAFRYGVPPHGGFAFGVDRMMMMLLNKDSLRDVIAFPKAQNGSCLMMETPSDVSADQLAALGLQTGQE